MNRTKTSRPATWFGKLPGTILSLEFHWNSDYTAYSPLQLQVIHFAFQIPYTPHFINLHDFFQSKQVQDKRFLYLGFFSLLSFTQDRLKLKYMQYSFLKIFWPKHHQNAIYIRNRRSLASFPVDSKHLLKGTGPTMTSIHRRIKRNTQFWPRSITELLLGHTGKSLP